MASLRRLDHLLSLLRLKLMLLESLWCELVLTKHLLRWQVDTDSSIYWLAFIWNVVLILSVNV